MLDFQVRQGVFLGEICHHEVEGHQLLESRTGSSQGKRMPEAETEGRGCIRMCERVLQGRTEPLLGVGVQLFIETFHKVTPSQSLEAQ